jgi:ComF family protein
MVLAGKVRAAANYLLNFAYPPRCLVCGIILTVGGPEWFCGECSGALNVIAPPARDAPPEKHSRGFGVRSVLVYDELTRRLIHNFKYSNNKRAAVGIARLMFERRPDLLSYVSRADALTPVPLHKSRLRERGFNQAAELAAAISEITGIPTRNALSRTRKTAKQSATARALRRVNIKGAFSAEPVPGLRLMLVDDIYTTGATLSECADALWAAGASGVDAVTAARTEDKSKTAGTKPV